MCFSTKWIRWSTNCNFRSSSPNHPARNAENNVSLLHMRMLRAIVVSLLVLWLLFLGAIYFTMRQPPERFASAIAKLPGPAFMLFPFEPLWFRARAGSLKVGDPAPD